MFLDDVEVTVFSWNPISGTADPRQSNIEWYGSAAPTRLFSGMEGFLHWGGQGGTKTVNDYMDVGEFYVTGVKP